MRSLRPYQYAAQSAVLRHYLDGEQRGVVVLPTGAGKTFTATSMAPLICPADGRILWLAHMDELIAQAYQAFVQVYPADQVGIVKAARNDVTCPVVVASKDTLAQKHRLQELLRYGQFDYVVCDEAQHAVTPVWQRIIDASLGAHGLLLGLTATPYRADMKSLKQVFRDGVFYALGLFELMVMEDPETGEAYLADILPPVVVETDVDLSQVTMEDGDYNLEQLSNAVYKSKYRHRQTVEAWIAWGERRLTILFAVDRRDALAYQDAFNQANIPAVTVFGDTPPEERKRILGDARQNEHGAFEHGEYHVLILVGVGIEGLDLPFVACIVMARHCKAVGGFLQRLGRGSRLAPGKTDCIVIDVADNQHSGLTVSELIGSETPVTTSVRKYLQEQTAANQSSDAVQLQQLAASAYRLKGKEQNIFDMQVQGRWHLHDDGTLRFDTPAGNYAIEDLGGVYRPAKVKDGKLVYLCRAAHNLTIAAAMVKADALLKTARHDRIESFQANPDRYRQPATEKQRAFAAKLRLGPIVAAHERIAPWTTGDLSDLITEKKQRGTNFWPWWKTESSTWWRRNRSATE